MGRNGGGGREGREGENTGRRWEILTPRSAPMIPSHSP